MREAGATEYVVRFSFWARFQHATVILLFGALLVTGMPQKWPYLDASRWVIDSLGGIFAVRWLHRAAGIALSGLFAAHLAGAVTGVVTRRSQPSMLLARKDFRDAVDNLRYYVGRAETPPRFGRFDYRQKFEYWGLIFGAAIMALSGFILYFPIFFSRVLPAELIPAAKVMHSNEALLAFLIVLIWHMAGAHLTPESFPMDTSIFTGKIRKDKLRREHALEYDERFGGQ
ncbi:MAG: cytochrome b/b6 domain-containing protein [Candidatus Rokubacteria bacterium]|nr:cytochrome b/b6 domain-containing protein [Candidatus Rokubacteria bacterium]